MNCTTPLPHLEALWLRSMRDFLASINGTIEVDNPYILLPQREHDLYLMDAVIASGYFKPVEIQQIKYCRLYLQAVTLSDVTKPDGQRLNPHMLLGNILPHSSRPRHHRTNQGRPHCASWGLWHCANRLWADSSQQLKQPLGWWLVPADQLRQDWVYYYDTQSDELLIQDKPNYFFIHPRQQHGFSLQPDGHTNTLPPGSLPASILSDEHGWLVSRSVLCIPTYPTLHPGTLMLFLQVYPNGNGNCYNTRNSIAICICSTIPLVQAMFASASVMVPFGVTWEHLDGASASRMVGDLPLVWGRHAGLYPVHIGWRGTACSRFYGFWYGSANSVAAHHWDPSCIVTIWHWLIAL